MRKVAGEPLSLSPNSPTDSFLVWRHDGDCTSVVINSLCPSFFYHRTYLHEVSPHVSSM